MVSGDSLIEPIDLVISPGSPGERGLTRSSGNSRLKKLRRRAIMGRARIVVPKESIAHFCRRYRIRRLSLFGSVLREDFGPDSDVDVLVEFEPGARVGLIRLAGMELELGTVLGRKVDLNTPGFLSDYYRDQVLAEAEIQYDAA
jgi:predicted nucleotidyltransferase